LSCETENPCVRKPVCSKQGLCTGEARADGTPCELAGGCLAGGACQGGECTQLTTQADGTACEDGYLCTRGERCLAGACTGGQPQAGCDGGRVPIDAGLTTPPPLPWCTCRVGSPNRASPLGTMLEFWLLCVGTWLLRGRRHRGSDRHGRAVGDCPRT
jgi:hypothetical protein